MRPLDAEAALLTRSGWTQTTTLEVGRPTQDIELRDTEEELVLVFEGKLELEIDFSSEHVTTVSLGL